MCFLLGWRRAPLVDLSIITSNSDVIILNVVLFFLFALIGSFDLRRKGKKGQVGVSAATTIIVAESFGFSQRLWSVVSFIVGFYIQMHGLAVSAYSLLWLFGQEPLPYLSGYMLEIPGITMFGVGCALVILAWGKIFEAKNKYLVTEGLYKHVRHPQYLGILIATLGMIVYKFSPISIMLWPILLFLYYRLARKEEKIMHNIYGTQYLEYKSKVPMFLPVKFGRDPSLSYKSEVVNEPRSKQGNVTELGN
jgi:protein-S-isoprenylcysteine O-methyltransferase Ste14